MRIWHKTKSCGFAIAVNCWLFIMLVGTPLMAVQLHVGSDHHLKSLTSAIDVASPGDTITLSSATYRESNIVIDKSLTVIGNEWPIIDGTGGRSIITVTAPNVTISGLDIRGAPVSFIDDNAAVLIEGSENCMLRDNRFRDNFFAVYLAKSRNCQIIDNEIVGSALTETRSGNGIHIWYCSDITVSGNSTAGHRDGIYFEFVKHSYIADNTSERNLRYGLHFMFSDSCTYSKNAFLNNGSGVAVMYTHGVKMIDNRFRGSWGPSSYGLLLKEISDSRVYGNLFEHNSIGIYIEGCNRVEIEKNDLLNNGWAMRIMANAMDNSILRNNFIGNSFQVATDSRQNFSRFAENYWSDYSGYDLDRDGYGDVPFRPVTLFSMVVHRNPPTLVLLRSLTIDLLNMAERLLPGLTPATLVDDRPAMEPIG